MKVFVFTPISLRVAAGAEQDLYELISTLTEQGHEVTVVDIDTPHRGELRLSRHDVQKRIANSIWISLPPLWGSGKVAPMPGLRALLVLRRKMKGAQLVILNQYYGTDLLLTAISKLNGKAVVCSQANPLRQGRSRTVLETLQGMYFRIVWPIVARRFDAIRVYNRDDVTFLRALGGKASIIYPTIRSDWSGLGETPRTRPEGRPSDVPEFKILAVGRMTPQKGIDTLAGVIDSLAGTEVANRNRMVFVLAGVRELPPVLASAQARHPSSVRSIGVLPDRGVLDKIREADVFLVPSRHETFGIVALEALSQGLFVVASDIPGLRDAVEGSPGGFLVPVGSVVRFSTVLTELAELKRRDPERWNKLREETRSHAAHRYNREAYRSSWENLIQAALRDPRSPPSSAS